MDQKELKDICSKLKLALPKGSANPALLAICFKSNKVMAFDGITGVITKVPVDISCCVPGASFIDQISKLKGELDLTLKGEKLTLTCGSFKAHFKTFSHLDFPDFVPQDRSELVSGSGNLIPAFKIAVGFAGEEANALGGLCVVGNKVFACNGRTATKVLLDNALTHMVHLPVRFIQCLLKFEQPKMLFRANDMVGAYLEDSVVITRQIVPRFPHEQVDTMFDLPGPELDLPEELEGALDRISASLDDSGDVSLVSDQTSLTVATQTAAEPLAWVGPKFNCRINAKRLLAALEITKTVRLGSLVSGENRALLFVGKIGEVEDFNFFHAVGLSD